MDKRTKEQVQDSVSGKEKEILERYGALYGTKEPTEPGLYLCLFHGYQNEDDRAVGNDWGANGPYIGPLEGYHVTYSDHTRINFVHSADEKKFCFPEMEDWQDLQFPNGCLLWDGWQWGDWTLVSIGGNVDFTKAECEICDSSISIGIKGLRTSAAIAERVLEFCFHEQYRFAKTAKRQLCCSDKCQQIAESL